MPKRWSTGAAVLAAALLAGCTGGSKVSAPSSSPASPESSAAPLQTANLAEPCSLLSNAAVGEVFSISKVTSAVKPPQKASNGLLMYFCEYRAEVLDSPLGALAVTSTDGSVTPAAVARAWLALPGAQQVYGVGEAAVYSVDEQKKIALFAAAKSTGGKTVGVIFTGSPRATQEMLSSLVKQAIDAL